MKYEQQLKKQMIPSWRLYYMAYSQLKQLLKQKSNQWLIQDEEEFEYILGSELSKVCRFLHHQLERINEQTHQLEKQCQQQRQRQQRPATNDYNVMGSPVMMDGGYATQVTELIFELHDTAQFLHANKTAFDKMVKKHDRYTNFSFQQRYTHLMATSSLDTYAQQLDSLMIPLCHLYDSCRQPRQRSAASTNDRLTQHEQQQQKLHCTTFWIHPDNLNEVKAICLFHLSMLTSIYPQSTKQTASPPQQDNSITSLYLDNANFDLYKKQVELCNDYNATLLGQDAATPDQWSSNRLVRCRWYGQDSSTMHLERKQSHGIGNQQRCIIDGVSEASYLNASHDNRDVENISSTRHLDNTYHQIQHSIRQQHLEPKCRTTCQRITFQHERGSTALRIHIDTNIKFSKISHGTNQNPQGHGTVGDKTLAFPWGLLTVHHPPGIGMANWLTQLLASHLVYPVPRFSTFAHAISLFYGDQLALSFLSPWWLLAVPKDIRKTPCNNIGLSRSASACPLIHGHRQPSFEQMAAQEEEENAGQHIVIPLTQHATAALDEDDHRKDDSGCWWRLRRRQRQRQQDRRDYHQRLESHDGSLLTDDGYLPGSSTMSIAELGSTTVISNGKKGAGTVGGNATTAKKDNPFAYTMINNRMTEPKTYFANERTFISWLQFCAVLLTVALSLFNDGDWISRWMGALFLCMTCLLTFYALGRFQYRSWQLRTRRYVLRYDDVFGPTVLCFFLVIAMMINFYLRLPLFEL